MSNNLQTNIPPPSVPYKAGLYEDLKDSVFAAEYLNAIFKDEHPELISDAIKDFIKANTGSKPFSDQMHAALQTQQTIPPEDCEPSLQDFITSLSQLGIKITFYCYR